MPVAGEEGYEELVICPYERSHEIRRGRMQFHLDKCRKNHPTDQLVQCLYNTTHIIPKVEEQFHTEEECGSRILWDSHAFEVGEALCPVKDLVPVNAATVPECEENWDNYETQGSVLNTIKNEAAGKKIFRMLQCESKAKRKMFREEEKLRHSNLDSTKFQETSTVSQGYEPIRRPTKVANVPIIRQDPQEAVAAISKQFRTLDMNIKPSLSDYPASETSSMYNGPPSTITPLDTSAGPSTRPSTAMSSAISMSSRMSTAASIAESASRLQQAKQVSDEPFCQIPIPGLGRGARRKLKS